MVCSVLTDYIVDVTSLHWLEDPRHNREHVNDVSQEVFLKMSTMRNLDAVMPANFIAYLHSVHRCRDSELC
eukprot:1988739-Amphidinium_carterae.1